MKYITGQNISPTITVISADVNRVDTVIENVKTVLADSYANAEFTISDAGTKMEAASKSNDTLISDTKHLPHMEKPAELLANIHTFFS